LKGEITLVISGRLREKAKTRGREETER